MLTRWQSPVLGALFSLLLGVLTWDCRRAPDAGGDQTPNVPGRWRKLDEPQFSEVQREQAEQLRSIGYLGGYETASGRSGVTHHERGRVYTGLNFYTSGHAPSAFLMDMDGSVVHRWQRTFADVFPESTEEERNLDQVHHWRRAFLYENGDLLAIYGGLGMVKLDRDSRVLWRDNALVHHDVHVEENGDIYTLTREPKLIPRVNERDLVAENFIAAYDANGRLKGKWSVLEAVENSNFAGIWDRERLDRGDIFHTNSIEVLDGAIASGVPEFSRGRVLTSMRNLDAIAVIDLEKNSAVWARTGPFKGQHDPRLISNGHLLLFDNYGISGKSAVLEFDLAADFTIVWSYRGNDESPFYSELCGTAQRLPNGSTLITESDSGRAFEVNEDGSIVWEFFNPERAGENREYIATLFEVVRIPREFPVDWAASNRQGASADRPLVRISTVDARPRVALCRVVALDTGQQLCMRG
jgi:hypothetical protein